MTSWASSRIARRPETMEGSPTNALAGRVAVITGAGSGFGRGCAISLASAGASVVVNDIDPEGADKTVAAIHDLGGEAVARRRRREGASSSPRRASDRQPSWLSSTSPPRPVSSPRRGPSPSRPARQYSRQFGVAWHHRSIDDNCRYLYHFRKRLHSPAMIERVQTIPVRVPFSTCTKSATTRCATGARSSPPCAHV